jgi:hypothetical protein
MKAMLPGFTLVDRSRYGNHGTLTGATWVQLPSGAWVMDFTSAANKVEIPANVSIADMPVFTFEAWVYIVGAGGSNLGRVFSKGDGNAIKLAYLSNRLQYDRYFSTATGSWISPTNSIIPSVWTHVQMSFDKSSDANNPVFCINGSLAAATEIGAPVGTASTDAAALLAIGNGAAADRYLNGYMSPPRLYNYIRTPAQALATYNAEKWAYGIV